MGSQSQTQLKQLSIHTREGQRAERHNVHLCESSRSNGRRKVRNCTCCAAIKGYESHASVSDFKKWKWFNILLFS